MTALAAALLILRTSGTDLSSQEKVPRRVLIPCNVLAEFVSQLGYDSYAAIEKLSRWWAHSVPESSDDFLSWTMEMSANVLQVSARPNPEGQYLRSVTLSSAGNIPTQWRTTVDVYGTSTEGYSCIAVMTEATEMEEAAQGLDFVMNLAREHFDDNHIWMFSTRTSTVLRSNLAVVVDEESCDRYRHATWLSASWNWTPTLSDLRRLFSWRWEDQPESLSDLLLTIGQAHLHLEGIESKTRSIRTEAAKIRNLTGSGREGLALFQAAFTSINVDLVALDSLRQALELNVASARRLIARLNDSVVIGEALRREVDEIAESALLRQQQAESIAMTPRLLHANWSSNLEVRFARSQATLTAVLACVAFFVTLVQLDLGLPLSLTATFPVFAMALAWIDKDQQYTMWHVAPWSAGGITWSWHLWEGVTSWWRLLLLLPFVFSTIVVRWLLRELDVIQMTDVDELRRGRKLTKRASAWSTRPLADAMKNKKRASGSSQEDADG